MFQRLFILFHVLASLLAISSCGNTKEVTMNESWYFELKKGGCLDVCKTYNINIESDGNYFYIGHSNVKHSGIKSGTLSVNTTIKLKTLIDQINWASLVPLFGSAGESIARKQMTFNQGMETGGITYYRLEPQEIREIENYIDLIIDANEF